MTEFSGLPLTIKTHPRARRVLVKLIPNQGLEVVVPRGFDAGLVPEILAEKQAWIERTRARMEARGTDLSGQPADLPQTIHFRALEREYQVSYLDRSGRISVAENGPRLIVAGPMADADSLLDALGRFTVRKAREFLLPRLDAMSRRLGLPYAALRVRRQKTRWGSCSARGTISLNAKLLFLSPDLVDHLLIHELCHLRHLNHSKRYWALVASHAPDYERLEHELKHGARLSPDWFE